MKMMKLALCGAAASLAMAGSAFAQVSVNAGVTSEYVFRGLSQDGAAGFGGIDYSTDDWYVGTWFSDVAFASAETDLYAGWTPSAGGVDFDLGVVYYGYINPGYTTYLNYKTGVFDTSINPGYWEVKASASVPLGMGSVSGSIYYSPDFFAEGGSATYYEIGFDYPWEKVDFSGAVGVQTISDTETLYYGSPVSYDDSYTTWNIGFTIPVTDNFSADVRYIGTSNAAGNFGNYNLSGVDFNGIVGTLTATFP